MLLTVRQIELKNWMTHREESVEFPDNGIFLLWGRSGSGKSSLLEAIAFALAGISATRAKSLDELKHELYPDENMEVRLTLGIGDGREVQIYRGVDTKNKSSSWIVDENGSFVEGNKLVSEKIDDLLGGMDGPTLFSTYYSQQGELDALIKMAGGGRRKFVQRMLGVHVLDTVLRDLSRNVNNLGERINLVEESLPNQSVEELNDAKKKTFDTIQNKIKLQKQFVENLEVLEIRGKQLREELDQSKKSWEEYNILLPQIKVWENNTLPQTIEKEQGLQKQLQLIKEAKKRLKASPDLNFIENLEKEAENLAEKEGALHSLQSKEAEIISLRHEIEVLDKEILECQGKEILDFEDPQTLQIQLSNVQNEYASNSKALKALIKQYQDAPEICPTCKRSFDEASKTHAENEFQNKQKELEDQKTTLHNSGTSLRKRFEEAKTLFEKNKIQEEHKNKILNQKQTVEKDLFKQEENLKNLKEKAGGADAQRLREVRQSLSKLAVEKAGIQNDKNIVDGEEEIILLQKTTKQQIQDLEKQIQDSRNRLTELKIDPEKREKTEIEYEQTRNDYAQSTKTLGEINTDIEKQKGEKSRVDDLIKRHADLRQQRKEAYEQSLKLQKTKDSITDFRHNLIGSIRPMLQDLTSSHLAELTEGSMPSVDISEDYDLSIKRNGEFRRIGLCSGGEMARAAFSLRLALTQLVSQRTDTPVGFMVFDEIFGSQDDEHRKAILDALVHLRGIYPQIFLISHEETLKDSPLVSMILSVPESSSANRITVENR